MEKRSIVTISFTHKWLSTALNKTFIVLTLRLIFCKEIRMASKLGCLAVIYV